MKKGTKVKLDMDAVGKALRQAHGWSIDQMVSGTVEQVVSKRVGVQIGKDVLWFDKPCVKVEK